MKTIGLALALAWAIVGSGAAAADFPLRGLVTDPSGDPLQGVDVLASGQAGEFRALTAPDGTFLLALPEGEYDLLFSYSSDYYPTRLTGVEIRLVEEAAHRNPDPGQLRVILTNRLQFELDQVIVGPQFVDPPALKVEFLPQVAPAAGGLVAGLVRITNQGREDVQLPAVQEADYEESYSPEMLLMQVQVEIPDLEARFDRPFVCRETTDCRTLKPSESLLLPITVHTRETHQSENPEPATYPASGPWRGTVQLYMVFPGGGESPAYTRPLRADFSFEPGGAK